MIQPVQQNVYFKGNVQQNKPAEPKSVRKDYENAVQNVDAIRQKEDQKARGFNTVA